MRDPVTSMISTFPSSDPESSTTVVETMVVPEIEVAKDAGRDLVVEADEELPQDDTEVEERMDPAPQADMMTLHSSLPQHPFSPLLRHSSHPTPLLTTASQTPGDPSPHRTQHISITIAREAPCKQIGKKD